MTNTKANNIDVISNVYFLIPLFYRKITYFAIFC